MERAWPDEAGRRTGCPEAGEERLPGVLTAMNLVCEKSAEAAAPSTIGEQQYRWSGRGLMTACGRDAVAPARVMPRSQCTTLNPAS